MSRPSNSGIATCIAASMGASPAALASQSARLLVTQSPCRTGTSRACRARASHVSASLWLLPPPARTVTTKASTRPASSSLTAGICPSDPGRSEAT